VCPRQHIKSALDLQPGEDGAAILQHMIDLAHRVVTENGLSTTVEPPQLSFHVPPFNSIDHLHLHVIPGA
jgi:sulfate adenylyltransferase (ADP) / adenylylsulfatase